MAKFTDKYLSDLTGFSAPTVFWLWLNPDNKKKNIFKSEEEKSRLKFRYEALRLGAVLLMDGISLSSVSLHREEQEKKNNHIRRLKKENRILKEQVIEYKSQINLYLDKVQDIRDNILK